MNRSVLPLVTFCHSEEGRRCFRCTEHDWLGVCRRALVSHLTVDEDMCGVSRLRDQGWSPLGFYGIAKMTNISHSSCRCRRADERWSLSLPPLPCFCRRRALAGGQQLASSSFTCWALSRVQSLPRNTFGANATVTRPRHSFPRSVVFEAVQLMLWPFQAVKLSFVFVAVVACWMTFSDHKRTLALMVIPPRS